MMGKHLVSADHIFTGLNQVNLLSTMDSMKSLVSAMDAGPIAVYVASGLLALTVFVILIIIIYHLTKTKNEKTATDEDLSEVFVIRESRQDHSTPAPPAFNLHLQLAHTTLQPFRELFTPHSEDNGSAQDVDDLCVSRSFIEDRTRTCSWNYSFEKMPEEGSWSGSVYHL